MDDLAFQVAKIVERVGNGTWREDEEHREEEVLHDSLKRPGKERQTAAIGVGEKASALASYGFTEPTPEIDVAVIGDIKCEVDVWYDVPPVSPAEREACAKRARTIASNMAAAGFGMMAGTGEEGAERICSFTALDRLRGFVRLRLLTEKHR